MKTYVTKPAEIERKWFVIDAEGKILGRLAAEAAAILRGKKKPIFQPNVDAGDYVIVVNAGKILLTANKAEKKSYFVVSTGYVGHNKFLAYKDLKAKYPERIVERAVKGMLPHNTLGRQMFKKLRVFAGPDHDHQAQKPEMYAL